MSAKQKKQIKAIVQKLKTYKPERVILFGSYAWGKPTKSSDLDLLIIKKTKKKRLRRAPEVYKLLFYAPLPIDALV